VKVYDGSLLVQLQALLAHPMSSMWSWLPTFSLRAFVIFAVWYALQVSLAWFVPGQIDYGQETPAGHVLKYKVNGLRAWIITHVLLYLVVFQLRLFRASILYDEWFSLFLVANLFGWFLALFAYFKAYYFPSHPDDCKFSGSVLYDLFMGIELNPRFGELFDFKLFCNGRPGILAWNLINISMAAKQYELHGEVTNSMIAVIILHLTYILDFFYNEGWYLRTIDISHDHFGFYLAWGDHVWLPFLYTLQSFFLVHVPVKLSIPSFLFVLALGFSGYFIFRSVNDQKDKFRASKGNCKIWGKKAQFIKCIFYTKDGKQRESLLLTSGWWGLSRHFNYVGDLLISTAFCLSCGISYLLPYFYIIYMTILLVHRVGRDDLRLRQKYGAYWTEYCRKVPFKILPYVF